MTLLADESVEYPIVLRLREAGYACESIFETEPSIEDEAVLNRAFQNDVVLLTADKDFGELVFQNHQQQAGVILLRLRELSLARAAEEVVAALAARGADMPGAFTVISPGKVRTRPRSSIPSDLYGP